jgi:hypothetical protein
MKAIKNTNNFFTQFGVKEHRKLDYTKIHHKGLQELEFPNSTIFLKSLPVTKRINK